MVGFQGGSWRPLEATERLKQYVSFTLKQWDCINPLGFAKTNKSVVKSPFDLFEKYLHPQCLQACLWFGLVWFWGATSCRSVCYHNNNKLENHLFTNT